MQWLTLRVALLRACSGECRCCLFRRWCWRRAFRLVVSPPGITATVGPNSLDWPVDASGVSVEGRRRVCTPDALFPWWCWCADGTVKGTALANETGFAPMGANGANVANISIISNVNGIGASCPASREGRRKSAPSSQRIGGRESEIYVPVEIVPVLQL